MNALTWAFNFDITFSNVFIKSLALVADLNLETSAILNASSNIFFEFRMLFDDVNSFYDDDKCLMFNLKWTFNLVDTFMNIWSEFQTFADDLNFWALNLVNALLNILVKSFAFNTNLSLWTFVNSKALLNIFLKSRRLIDSAIFFTTTTKV